MQYIKLCLATLLLSLPACDTTPDPAPSDCPPVECGWAADGSCPEGAAFRSENTREDLGGGATCFVFTAACVSAPVAAECVPQSCKQNQFATCVQP